MALASLCQHMICVSSMPLTFSHTWGKKNIKNGSLLTQEVSFTGREASHMKRIMVPGQSVYSEGLRVFHSFFSNGFHTFWWTIFYSPSINSLLHSPL